MKTPNDKLAQLLERSRMSRGELARRVKSKALQWNQPHISPDATRVRCWLEGETPRDPVPDILAGVFSDHFGFRVTTYDLGLGDGGSADAALVYNPSYVATVEVVADLGRADVDRRKFLAAAPFAAVAGVGPSRDWLLNTLDQEPEPGPRVRLEDVSAVKNMFTTFQRMDIFQGGGSGRLVLAEYMTQHVYPLLRRAHSEDVRHALCEAAAEQTYLLGWMAYDNGEHSIAQRYLIQSLRLAQESRNPALGAHVLAGMADQATLLGDPAEGRRLAQAGRQGLSRATSPACLADLWCLEARALALLGDRSSAAHAVVQSERAYERVNLDEEPDWAAFIDPAYLHGEHANTFRDLGDAEAAEEHARRSIAHAAMQKRARRGAMSQAALAVSHLQRRDLDSAYAAGVRTLKLTRQVKSSRAVEAVQDLQKRMQPFGRSRLVADFNAQARELVAA
ncbi:transcriptional regulator [Streptomyces sp. AK010]|uniref:transcriptional regulator n=1 Tax=Streptomyces sp. AK010 TaxID=2723074 RepID=UPI00161B0995|nr:transcriptional regulator [Streptomyces sp. AK010]MBB6415851.1 tetratricopeptide (TPR) repeat protein [Streptomyces sp. AK010]